MYYKDLHFKIVMNILMFILLYYEWYIIAFIDDDILNLLTNNKKIKYI